MRKKKAPEFAQCEVCGKTFQKSMKTAKYCSDKCRKAAVLQHHREVKGITPDKYRAKDDVLYGKDDKARIDYCMNHCPFAECKNCYDNSQLKGVVKFESKNQHPR